ncbi:transcriptional regulator family: HMG [Agaricus bisporus var. burnettii]|uniref:Transcriptional regulator family: HMG n=1 Tax=Agaricus bisporus var. burnettii TaxID=192524 RepID=A0A8H7C0M4_AGABI|nr:transcriptional regulator family: HMG [Agaricus bisporus var. burnettii]
MLFRLPLLSGRVALPIVAPRHHLTRPLLTRSFSSTPWVFSPTKAKAASTTTTKTKVKAKPKSTTKTTTKAKVKAKPKAKTTGRKKKVAKKVAKPVFTREQLKVPTRRPAGGYLTFVAEQFAKQPKVSTSEGARERTRNIAAQWRTLTEQEQQAYKDKATEAGKKVKADFETWIENLDPAILREINRRRKARGKQKIRAPSKGPKGPVPAFLQFLGDFKADNPNLAIKELGKEGGVAWRQLPQARKDVYLLAYRNARKALEARA